MAYYDDLVAARNAAAVSLRAAMEGSTVAGGKPNSVASGVDHAEYVKRLRETIRDLNEQIIAAAEGPAGDGPWEELSQGYPG